MKRFNLVVGKTQGGMRMDQFLAESELGLSKRKIRAVIDAGGVYHNRRRVRIASREVASGDKVEIEFELENLRKLKARSFAFADADIIFEQHGIICVNKPAGLPTQATRDQSIVHVEPCLRAYLKERGRQVPSLILVHRLDKETSGLLLIATNAKVATWLTDQFRERKVDKLYEAIIYGVPSDKEFTQRCYLSPIDKNGLVSVVRSGGKSAVTHFKVIESTNKPRLALVECRPETGRSHQIRVHLNMIRHGIIGDKRYEEGRVPLPEAIASLATERHMLHARRLRFQPSADLPAVDLVAPRPDSFQKVLDLAFPR